MPKGYRHVWDKIFEHRKEDCKWFSPGEELECDICLLTPYEDTVEYYHCHGPCNEWEHKAYKAGKR